VCEGDGVGGRRDVGVGSGLGGRGEQERIVEDDWGAVDSDELGVEEGAVGRMVENVHCADKVGQGRVAEGEHEGEAEVEEWRRREDVGVAWKGDSRGEHRKGSWTRWMVGMVPARVVKAEQER